MGIRDYFSDDDVKTAAEAIISISEDDDAPPSTRLSASMFIIEQVHGKARQFVEQTTRIQGYQDLLGTIQQSESRFIQVTDVTPLPLLPAPVTLEDLIR